MIHNRRTISIFSLQFCLVLLAGLVFVRPAQALWTADDTFRTVRLSDAMELPEAPEISAEYGILIDARSGAILYEKNAYATAFPASTTKILTGLLTMENCDLSDVVTFSYRATHELEAGGSTIARTEGEEMTVEQCLYGLLVSSANEVAQGLAEHISGSFENFALLMNERARELGAVNTHFTNPHGLHDDNHYSCAHDIALFLRAAVQNDILREIMGTEKYQIPPTNKHSEITYLRMKHPLLTDLYDMRYAYAVAGKTGTTDQALNTLATYAVKGDMELISVVLRASGLDNAGRDSSALLDYGFANYSVYNLSGNRGSEETGTLFLSSQILEFADYGAVYMTLPNTIAMENITQEIVYGEIAGNSGAVGQRLFLYNGVKLAAVPLSIGQFTPAMPLDATVNIAPTTREILLKEYLGVALVDWLIILGLLLVVFLILFVLYKIIRRHFDKKEEQQRSRRNMLRLAEQEQKHQTWK